MIRGFDNSGVVVKCGRCELIAEAQGDTFEMWGGFGFVWDVTMLKLMAEVKPNRRIRIEQFRSDLARRNWYPGHVPHVDLKAPILVGTIENCLLDHLFVIDGTHRLVRAFAEGRVVLPAFVFNAEETQIARSAECEAVERLMGDHS